MVMFLQFLCQVAKEYFPDVAVGYDDPRVKLFVGDGKAANIDCHKLLLISVQVKIALDFSVDTIHIDY